MKDTARKVGMLRHGVVKLLVGRNNWQLFLHSYCKIETIVDVMIEISGETPRRSGELAHGDWNGNRSSLRYADCLCKISLRDDATAAHDPQRVGRLGEKKLRRDERQLFVQKT